jgi:acyl-CoA dehydrogenase
MSAYWKLPFFEDHHFALRELVQGWVGEHCAAPKDQACEVEEEARRLVKSLGEKGLLCYAIPRKFGGKRESVQTRDLCIVREELARGSALADTMFAMQALGSYPLTRFGTEAQRQRYLPPIATGSAIAAFALTEPDAGSDVSAIQSRAVRHGKEYCLNGVKRFISNAGIADSYIVFASTEPEKKGKGLSAFVVDANNPGLIVTEQTQVISPHPIGVVAFKDCVIAETSLIGKENDGLAVALGTLDVLRCSVGAAALGLAQRALDEAVDYSSKRRQFNHALAEFQGIQFKLADMATELEAARLLVYQAAWASDVGAEDAKQKSSMAKLFATEAAQKIVDQALQIHGGIGLIAGSIMERLYRDVRALRIYEGTSEIQKLVIARTLLKKA